MKTANKAQSRATAKRSAAAVAPEATDTISKIETSVERLRKAAGIVGKASVVAAKAPPTAAAPALSLAVEDSSSSSDEDEGDCANNPENKQSAAVAGSSSSTAVNAASLNPSADTAANAEEEEEDGIPAAGGTGAGAGAESEKPVLLYDRPARAGPKTWKHRPQQWQEIAAFYMENDRSLEKTIEAFPDCFQAHTRDQSYHRITRWTRDVKENRELLNTGRSPAYGQDIDKQLIAAVKMRIESSLPIDEDILRELLIAVMQMEKLKGNDKTNLLRENGGECIFGKSWAQRFFNRHSLRPRSTDGVGRKRKRRSAPAAATTGSRGGANGGEKTANAAASLAADGHDERDHEVSFSSDSGSRGKLGTDNMSINGAATTVRATTSTGTGAGVGVGGGLNAGIGLLEPSNDGSTALGAALRTYAE